MIDIKAIYIGRLMVFFGAAALWLLWLATLSYPLDLLVGGISVILAFVLARLRDVPGRDLLFVASVAAIYAVVEGVVR